VPEGEPLWLIVSEKNAPADVVTIAPLDHAQTVDARVPSRGRFLLTSLHIAERDRAAIQRAHGFAMPRIRLSSIESEPFALLDGARVLIAGVSPGDAELEIGGPGWLPEKKRVKVSDKHVTIIDESLDALAAATVVVYWSTSQNLAKLRSSFGACEGDPVDHRIDVTVASSHETYPADQTSGMLTARDIPPGSYRAVLRFGDLPPVEMPLTAPGLQQTAVTLQAFYKEIHGDLTRAGKPFRKDTLVQFRGGLGFAARDGAEYHAVALGPIKEDDVIDVATCDSSFKAQTLSDHAVSSGGLLDIDIPDGELTIHVIDTFTRETISGATIRYVVLSRLMRPAMRGALTTSESGNASIANLPDRLIRLTVTAPHYETREVPPFRVSAGEKKTVDVQLVPRSAGHGRIVSDHFFEGGTIAWHSPDGTETEHAQLSGDGTFVYAKAHHADELMIVVSRSHALWIARSPELDPNAMPDLVFPNAPAKQVSFRNPPPPFVLAIGGLRVPPPVLEQYQRMRRVLVVLETGPIEVLATTPVEPDIQDFFPP